MKFILLIALFTIRVSAYAAPAPIYRVVLGGGLFMVTENSVRLRESASTTSGILKVLNRGDIVRMSTGGRDQTIVNGVRGSWVYIETFDYQPIQGAIFDAYLTQDLSEFLESGKISQEELKLKLNSFIKKFDFGNVDNLSLVGDYFQYGARQVYSGFERSLWGASWDIIQGEVRIISPWLTFVTHPPTNPFHGIVIQIIPGEREFNEVIFPEERRNDNTESINARRERIKNMFNSNDLFIGILKSND